MSEATPDFESLLSTQCDDDHEPMPLPKGMYNFTVGSKKEFGKSSQKGTPYVELELIDPVPGSDVDDEEFEACVASRPKGVHVRATFYLTDAARFMLKNFFKAVGIDTTGRSYADCLDEVSGEQVGAFVEIETTDKGRHYNNVSEFCAPA